MDFKRFNGSTWETVQHKIYGSGTDSLTAFPAIIQASGDPLTDYKIYGNTVQNGTPTPEAPVDVIGCGERTGNLFGKNAKSTANGFMQDTMLQSDGTTLAWNVFSVSEYIPIESGAGYYISDVMNAAFNAPSMCFYDSSKQFLSSVVYQARNNFGFSAPAGAAYVRISYMNAQADSVMLNTGSTALPYEPFGYKIPITVNGTEHPIYLGQVESTRRIKKLVLTGEETWTYESDYTRFYTIFQNSLTIGIRATPAFCTHFQVISDSRPLENVPNYSMYSNTVNMQWFFKNTEYTTVDAWKSYLAAQYANGTPATVWYVLAEPETAVVNEPMHKIGNYADTITMTQAGVTISTFDGDNAISFGTTVQPSAMSAAFKGWHPVQGAKAYDGNDWS